MDSKNRMPVSLVQVPECGVFILRVHNPPLFRYVLSSKIENKEDDYVFIYYRGKNDAWDGYGGAVVYTKSPTLPASIVPELQAAAKRVNLNFNKFTTTDNTCGPEPPLLARLEKKVNYSLCFSFRLKFKKGIDRS